MALLGDHFPTDKVREQVVKQLTPGRVIRIEVTFPEKTKPKFLVLVGERDPDCLTFIVNSEIHPFVANRPHLARCQVAIDRANHPFLTRDSHIACHQLLVLNRSDVIRDLMTDLGAIKGEISQDVRAQILAAVKFAKTLDVAEKNTILQALT